MGNNQNSFGQFDGGGNMQSMPPVQGGMPGGMEMNGVSQGGVNGGMPNGAGQGEEMPQYGMNVQPVMQGTGQPVPVVKGPAPTKKFDVGGMVKSIAIVILSLTTVAFIGLFIWMSGQYDAASTDVNGQIAEAVAAVRVEQAEDDESEFAEREKYPYRTFSGPVDYGQLTFEYPKTWSVYVASDASRGGDYNAYFNPIEVQVVSNTTINALRLTIRDAAFDDVAGEYQRYLDQQDSGLSMESVTVGGTAANRYTGKIPGTEFSGIVVIFKIRDKTAILQTDSVLFAEDFNRLIDSITFNA